MMLEKSALVTGGISTEVADALGNLRDVVLPVIFVFDGHISCETMFANFVEDREVIDHTGAEWTIMGMFSNGPTVFHMEGAHTRRDFLDDFKWFQTGGGPVA